MTKKEINHNQNNSNSCKRCEYMGEFLGSNPNNPLKICAYKCRGYNVLATFSSDKNKPCSLSFDGNFPDF